MFMNLGVILFVLFIAYLWTQQGAFSAFLHFVITVIAGAVALAAWEPVVYGLLLGARQDLAWSLGLIVPFLIALAALRLLSDKFIPGNLQVDDATNFVLGGAFGLGAGIVTAGILLISIGFMRLPHDFGGYTPARYDTSGSIVAGDSLWLPADRLTVDLYETLSMGAFTPGQSALAIRQPNLHRQAGYVRLAVRDKGNIALTPDAVELIGTYRVQGAKSELLSDSFFLGPDGQPVPQQVVYPDGSAPPPNMELFGVSLAFYPAARENTGQVVVGPGQVRLIVRTPEGETLGVHPAAVISQAQGGGMEFGRWRFDAEAVWVASTSTAAATPMAFEFPIPEGSEPIDLLIKNLRIPASKFSSIPGAPEVFASAAARDEAIRDGAVVGRSIAPSNTTTTSSDPASSAGAGAGAATIAGDNVSAWREAGLMVSSSLPTGPLAKSKIRGSTSFNSDEDGITRADIVANLRDISFSSGPQNLSIDQFAGVPDARIVQVDISYRSPLTIAGRAVDQAMRFNVPVLRDTNGQTYTPIGYFTEDGDRVELKFDPGAQMQMGELPTISRSAQQVRVVLIYAVTNGVSIREFAFGSEPIARFEPPAQIGR